MIEELKEKTNDMLRSEPDEVNAGIDATENLVAFAAAIGMTFLARNALQAGWRKTMSSDPPKNPASYEVDWRDALLWGGISGAVVGITRIVSRRASSSAYRSFRSR